MAGEIPFVSDEQIRSAAEKLQKAVVKVKGEKELRYVPTDPKNAYYGYGGRSSEKYPGLPFTIGPDKNYLGTAEDRAELSAQYSWIPDAFIQHVGADPRQIEPLSGPLRSVAEELYFEPHARPGRVPPAATQPVQNILDKAEKSLEHWTGHAADVFFNEFYKQIPEAARAQSYLAACLALAVEGNRDMFLSCRKDLLTTAEKALVAVEQAGECDPATVKTVLTVAGAVATIAAGVASIPLTGGATAAPAGVAAFTIIAGVSSGLAAADLGKKEETSLDADTVDGVLSKTVDTIIKIGNTVTEKEDAMIKALRETIDVVTGSSANRYMPPRPPVMNYSDGQIKTDTAFG